MTALREQYRFGAPVGRARASCAFTLVEVLIAIAILGVGITMAAALFPTAIKQNQRSANDTIGMIVAKNALAVVKARLTAGDLNSAGINDTELKSLGNGTGAEYLGVLSDLELTYPVPREPRASFMEDVVTGVGGDWWDDAGTLRHKALRGAVVLGREMTPGANDYQFVIVSFAKQPIHHNENRVIPQRVSGNVFLPPNTDASVFTSPDLQRGGVVILDYDPANPDLTGTFARITAMQGNQAVLDKDISVTGVVNAWIVVERDAANNVVGAWSPVTSVLVTRTALRN